MFVLSPEPVLCKCKACGEEKPHNYQGRNRRHLEHACIDCIQTLPPVPPGMKRCPDCLAIHDRKGNFYCRLCANAHRRASYTPEKGRQMNLEANYKMSSEKYEIMLAEQEGLCASCGKPETVERYGTTNGHRNLSVDHNHDTDEIRGLLCTRCNALLGIIERLTRVLDNEPEQVHQVLAYLECYQQIMPETLLSYLKKRTELT